MRALLYNDLLVGFEEGFFSKVRRKFFASTEALHDSNSVESSVEPTRVHLLLLFLAFLFLHELLFDVLIACRFLLLFCLVLLLNINNTK